MVKRETGEEIWKGRDRHPESDVEGVGFPDLSNQTKVAFQSSHVSLGPGLRAHLRISFFSRDAFLLLSDFLLTID